MCFPVVGSVTSPVSTLNNPSEMADSKLSEISWSAPVSDSVSSPSVSAAKALIAS